MTIQDNGNVSVTNTISANSFVGNLTGTASGNLPLSGGTLTGPVMKDKELLHLAYLNLGSGTTTGIIDIKLPNVNWMGDMYIDFYNYSTGLGGTLRCQIYTYYGSSTGFAGANSVS